MVDKPFLKDDRGPLNRSTTINTTGLSQDCGNSKSLAMELPQSCAKPAVLGSKRFG